MALSQDFSRDAFEKHAHPSSLSAELADLLTQRLRAASDPAAEAQAILDDLKAIGHALWSWDESADFMTYGDDYMRPGPTRFIVSLHWDAQRDDDATALGQPLAEVEFGPWAAAAH